MPLVGESVGWSVGWSAGQWNNFLKSQQSIGSVSGHTEGTFGFDQYCQVAMKVHIVKLRYFWP